MSVFNLFKDFNLVEDLNFIKDEIIDCINKLYIKNKININSDINFIYNIYDITYEQVKMYVELILDYKIKRQFIKKLRNHTIISDSKLDKYCSDLITDVLYIEIYRLFKNVNYNMVSLSF